MNKCAICGERAYYQRCRVDPKTGAVRRLAADLFCQTHWWNNEERKWWK